jgi:hypothetical protein
MSRSKRPSVADRALTRFRVLAAIAIGAGLVLVARGEPAAGWFVVAVGAAASAVGLLAAHRLRDDDSSDD